MDLFTPTCVDPTYTLVLTVHSSGQHVFIRSLFQWLDGVRDILAFFTILDSFHRTAADVLVAKAYFDN